jgi:glycosyltransferase involved in cell wall biosynthesis
MPPLKIAQVATSDLAIRFLLLDQIKALQRQGHEVVAICGAGPWVENLRSEGVPVEVVKMARELSPIRDFVSLFALARCFRKHRFDVIHTHTPKAGLLGPLAAKFARVPVIVHTIHGLMFHDRMPFLRRLLFWFPEKITASLSDFLLSQSQEDVSTATKYWLCPATKVRYLGNGIEVGKFSISQTNGARQSTRKEMGILDTDIVVGSVGRLVYEKGFGELFAAAKQLVERQRNLKFVIIGPEEIDQHDAVPRSQMEALTRTGSVFFMNWRDDLARWYACMDLFVLPSHREGVPRACMEAAAMGLPVIATDVRGCREVVVRNETGILVPLKDLKALVTAIEDLAHDKNRRTRFGIEGRRHVLRNFDHELVLERLRNFYSQIQLELQAARS